MVYTSNDQPYWLRILISIDQFLNTLLGGNEDETLSSRGGRAVLRTEDGYPNPGDWKLCLLCKLLDLIKKNHCVNSIGV